MSRKRIILFLGILLALLVVPTLLPYLLGGIVMPWWSLALYALIILVYAGLYLAHRCWLIDKYLIRGRKWAFLGWSALLILLTIVILTAAVEFTGLIPIPDGDISVSEFLGFGVMISQRVMLAVLAIVTVLIALAVAFSDEWRRAAFKYNEAENGRLALVKDVDALKGQMDAMRQSGTAPESITVKVDLVKTPVRLDDILYVKGDGDYINIFKTNGEKLMVLMTLKSLEKSLPFDRFCRIHRSYVVAIDKVCGFKGGKVLVGGEQLPLSDSCKPGFFELLSHKSIELRST